MIFLYSSFHILVRSFYSNQTQENSTYNNSYWGYSIVTIARPHLKPIDILLLPLPSGQSLVHRFAGTTTTIDYDERGGKKGAGEERVNNT